jgi:hypothetical protein
MKLTFGSLTADGWALEPVIADRELEPILRTRTALRAATRPARPPAATSPRRIESLEGHWSSGFAVPPRDGRDERERRRSTDTSRSPAAVAAIARTSLGALTGMASSSSVRHGSYR